MMLEKRLLTPKVAPMTTFAPTILTSLHSSQYTFNEISYFLEHAANYLSKSYSGS